MKKLLCSLLLIAAAGLCAACSPTQPVETPKPHTESSSNVNYLQATKDEVHDILFEEKTEETTKVIDKVFKHLEYEVLASKIDGDEAYMALAVQNVNCGQAWYQASAEYATLCLENTFSEKYLDEKELYNKYLDNVEKAIKKADYTTCVVEVEMELINHRWVCELTDELVDAMTGGLLSAIEGEGPVVLNTEYFTTLEHQFEVMSFQKKNNIINLNIKWTNNSCKAMSYNDLMLCIASQKDYRLMIVSNKNNNKNKVINPGESIEIIEAFEIKYPNDIIEYNIYNFITNELLYTYNLII